MAVPNSFCRSSAISLVVTAPNRRPPVPALAVLFYCIRIAVERRLREKGLPIPSAEYLNVDAYDTETESFVLHPDSEQIPAEKAPEENAPGSGTDKTE